MSSTTQKLFMPRQLSASNKKRAAQGFVTLVSVLVVGAVGIAVAVSLLLLGVGSSRTSFAAQQSAQARALADACAEEALQQINDSTPLTGSGNLSIGAGTCNYTVVSLGGQNRNIEAYGTVQNTLRKVEIDIDKINPSINITSWQEVADF
jgi:shikimate 5-dehydrogenase